MEMQRETPRIRAIPTQYGEIEFRSRLEANVARCLDAVKVPWTYEQEGYDLGAQAGWYLPDLWLPEARQFIEVKGQADDPTLVKSIALAHAVRTDLPDEEEAARPAAVVVLTAPFVRRGTWGLENEVFGFGFNGVEQVDALLVVCPHCAVHFFMTVVCGWTCSACGQWAEFHDPVTVLVEHARGETRYTAAKGSR